jgi:hypothetical protein
VEAWAASLRLDVLLMAIAGTRCPEWSLLALDQQQALSGEDEEVLLASSG